ncbi:MAG: hypothetical protein GXP45_03030 [bacterium]|nr:hypothetical protein [bacterium]
MLFGFIAWLISMRRKNNIIQEKNDSLQDKQEEIGRKNEELEEFKDIIDQSGNAVLIKDIEGNTLFENEIYISIRKQNIIST